jgi:hypothetical protein
MRHGHRGGHGRRKQDPTHTLLQLAAGVQHHVGRNTDLLIDHTQTRAQRLGELCATRADRNTKQRVVIAVQRQSKQSPS